MLLLELNFNFGLLGFEPPLTIFALIQDSSAFHFVYSLLFLSLIAPLKANSCGFSFSWTRRFTEICFCFLRCAFSSVFLGVGQDALILHVFNVLRFLILKKFVWFIPLVCRRRRFRSYEVQLYFNLFCSLFTPQSE